MSNKQKGSKAERELLQMFVSNNFRCVRVAGSGMMENADCDLIAGKIGEKYSIEVKSTKKTSKYITKEQMNNFLVFSEIFGLTPVIAVRFNRLGWFFLNPKDLIDSGKNWVISQENAREKGKRFSQFFIISNNNLVNNSEFDEFAIEIEETNNLNLDNDIESQSR